MNLSHKPLLIGAAVIVVGGALLLLTRNSTPSPEPAPLPTNSDAQLAHHVESAETLRPNPTPNAPLPWERALSGSPSAAAQPEVSSVAPSLEISPSLSVQNPAQMQKQLTEGSRALDQALAKFNEMEAAGKLPPEVDARAVRTNITLARRAQTLTSEMLALSQQPADDARSRRAEAIVAELRALQTQIQFDTTRPTPSAR